VFFLDHIVVHIISFSCFTEIKCLISLNYNLRLFIWPNRKYSLDNIFLNSETLPVSKAEVRALGVKKVGDHGMTGSVASKVNASVATHLKLTL